MRGPRLAPRSGGVVSGGDQPVMGAAVERAAIEDQGAYPEDGRMSPPGHTGHPTGMGHNTVLLLDVAPLGLGPVISGSFSIRSRHTRPLSCTQTKNM